MELLWFVIGAVVGAIALAVTCCVIKIDLPGDKEEDTQPEFRPIATQKDKEEESLKMELEQERAAFKTLLNSFNALINESEAWKRDAIMYAAMLGEQKIGFEELKVRYKHELQS